MPKKCRAITFVYLLRTRETKDVFYGMLIQFGSLNIIVNKGSFSSQEQRTEKCEDPLNMRWHLIYKIATHM